MAEKEPEQHEEQEPEQERSPGGAIIYRYGEGEPAGFQLAFGDEQNIEAISNHIEQHIGPISGVFHEILSDKVHVDVHYVEPSADFPFRVLVTSGMSDLPMTVPEGAEDARYAELCILLPSTWPVPGAGEVLGTGFQSEEHYWPSEWLKYLARFPHEYQTWIGFGHTIPNGADAEPFGPNTELGCMLLLPSMSLPEEFAELKISEDKTINFFCLYPIYKEEMDLKLEEGYEALMERFDEYEVSDVIDPDRPNTAKSKKNGFLGLW